MLIAQLQARIVRMIGKRSKICAFIMQIRIPVFFRIENFRTAIARYKTLQLYNIRVLYALKYARLGFPYRLSSFARKGKTIQSLFRQKILKRFYSSFD